MAVVCCCVVVEVVFVWLCCCLWGHIQNNPKKVWVTATGDYIKFKLGTELRIWMDWGSSLDGVPNHKLTYSANRTTTNLGESILRVSTQSTHNLKYFGLCGWGRDQGKRRCRTLEDEELKIICHRITGCVIWTGMAEWERSRLAKRTSWIFQLVQRDKATCSG